MNYDTVFSAFIDSLPVILVSAFLVNCIPIIIKIIRRQ